MPVALDVNVLPRGKASRTRKLHDAFFSSWLKSHPDGHVVRLDLAEQHKTLPVFDEWDITAKFEMLYGEGKLDGAAADRWNALTQLTDQLHAADIVVVSAPMWNFSIPWHLKRWIDCIIQGRLTFEFIDGQFRGLLSGRQGVILTTRDGAYPPGTDLASWDFQMPYLRHVLGFLGLDPLHEVIAEPMMMQGPEHGEAQLAEAIERAARLGSSI
jgi:FMN-dependent NADH-azoreductase